MTPAEWDACQEPSPMLRALQYDSDAALITGRKLRLFCCACCYLNRADATSARIDESERAGFVNPRGRRVEDHAWARMWLAGSLHLKQGTKAHIIRDLINSPWRPMVREKAYLNEPRAHAIVSAAAHAIWEQGPKGREGDERHRAAVDSMVFRERWITPTVVALAEAAYLNNAPSGTLDPARLAVLSDAVEEAGADVPELLAHLRSPGPHWRGCWAVDVLLGRE